MKRILAIAIVLVLAGCDRDKSIFLLEATQSPTPVIIQGARTLADVCPDLIDAEDRLTVGLAKERKDSVDVARELGSQGFVSYQVTIAKPMPGDTYDIGTVCTYDVVPGVGAVVSKVACAQLCDGSADDYLVKRK